MSDRLEALKTLDSNIKTNKSSEVVLQVLALGSLENKKLAGSAFSGSLDAAKALHKAVLPGWRYQLDNRFHDDGCTLIGPDEGKARGRTYATVKDNPARAWLLCIIRALISIEEQGT